MYVAIVIPFLNEERFLPEVLDAVAAQSRPPDSLILVDDGSGDGSYEIAAEFANNHSYARVLQRPSRPPLADRMAQAHELQAFQWALDHIEAQWEVVAKLDADIRLPTSALADLESRLEANPDIGVCGFQLSQREADGREVPDPRPSWHVRGATKFYRRECWSAISPLPPILGWDTIDEVRARMSGWRSLSFAPSSGLALHLRRTGSHDGVLRGYRRAGLAAYAYGAHPVHVLASAAARAADRPRPLCGINYLTGWTLGAVKRVPRAEPAARALVRRENLRRLRGLGA